MGTETQAFSNLCIRRIFRSATITCQVGPTQARRSYFSLSRAYRHHHIPYSARASFDNSIVGGFHPSVRRLGVTEVHPIPRGDLNNSRPTASDCASSQPH